MNPARRLRAAIAVAGAVTLVVVGAVWRYGIVPAPRFPALAAEPDASFTGTVAFLDEAGCLRVVPAGGGPVARPGFCDTRAHRVEWTAEGHLAVDSWESGSYRLVDPTTGVVLSRPGRFPFGRNGDARLAGGDTVETDHGDDDLRAAIVARAQDGGTRTLISVRAPADYSFETVGLSPDGRFLLAVDSDGRVLVGRAGEGLRLLATGADPYAEPAWYQPGWG